ncbi:MAG TPA: DUF6538 domain-containing protein, partial [Ferrovibrio sp.]|uniref:DUF6538 domain-containing protein n=1 Tax=Ferrovibrio sp. TaxID=1917215 RepID=UPI002ED0F06B
MLVDMKNLTKNAAGTYVYRRRVPTDLLEVIGMRELKRSLDTRDLATAIERFAAAQRWADGLIAAARSRPAAGDDYDRLAGRWLHGKLTAAAIETTRLPAASAALPADDFDAEAAAEEPPPADTRQPAFYDPGPAPWRQAQAEEAARAMGLKIRPGSRQWRQWQDAIDRALGELSLADEARAWNEPVPPHIEQRAARAMQPTISDGHARWLTKRGDSLRKRTDHEARYVLDLWLTAHGDSEIAQISKRQVAEFRDALIADGRAVATVKKMMQFFKGFIDAAIADGVIEIVNPAAGLSFAGIKSKSRAPKRRAFTTDELRRLFTDATFTQPDFKNPMAAAKFWLPLLALYSGARQSELIWLDSSDVTQIDGIDCITIREDAEAGRTLKTESAARIVPLHETLISLGFLDYAALLKGRLFHVPPDA